MYAIMTLFIFKLILKLYNSAYAWKSPFSFVQGNENMMYKEESWSGSMKKQRPPAAGSAPLPAALLYNGGGALPRRFSDEESQPSSSSSE